MSMCCWHQYIHMWKPSIDCPRDLWSFGAAVNMCLTSNVSRYKIEELPYFNVHFQYSGSEPPDIEIAIKSLPLDAAYM